MTRNILTLSIAVFAITLLAAPTVEAQRCGCRNGIGIGCRGFFNGGGSFDQDGMVQPAAERVGPVATMRGAVRDNFSPNRFYSYSNSGLLAANTHEWNMSQQNVYSWHGGYKNWQWGTPTAVVVPPTAGYQTSYAWGVGQTRSTPIHHQFGRGGAAMIGGGNGSSFRTTPYWPSSTDQFGLYPVRGPW